MDHRDGKWARQIINLQNDDGSWGPYFHSLSQPTRRNPITTEQALRRLRILGFTAADEPIRRTIGYMEACLRGERKMDDMWEKTHDWPLFSRLMLATWLKTFEPENQLALGFAAKWAHIVEQAFAGGRYDDATYRAAYNDELCSLPSGPRERDFITFYHISLLQGMLAGNTESRLLDYTINKPDGIYYVYNQPLRHLPELFGSRQASRYLGALELLSAYAGARPKLGFAVEWISANRRADGMWDLSLAANDGVYLPLSDSWRSQESRLSDCTERVTALLSKIESACR